MIVNPPLCRELPVKTSSPVVFTSSIIAGTVVIVINAVPLIMPETTGEDVVATGVPSRTSEILIVGDAAAPSAAIHQFIR